MTEQPRWRKSSHSSNGGNCVEVATNLTSAVPLRDSKAPDGPELHVTPDAFAGFLSAVKVSRPRWFKSSYSDNGGGGTKPCRPGQGER